MSQRPDHVIDPVCGMSVDVAAAEAAGRTVVHEGRTYAFCRDGCRRAFLEDPSTYLAAISAVDTSDDAHADWHAHEAGPVAAGSKSARPLPVIDAGMRRWYESCSCCLSEAYPEVKAALDAEKAAVAGGSVPA